MTVSNRFFLEPVGPAPDEYLLFVVERMDVHLFRAWKPDAQEITPVDIEEYAYWIPARAAAEGRSWRGGFPNRPDHRQTYRHNGSITITQKLIMAIDDGRIATAQLLDRWARRNPAARADPRIADPV